MFARRFIAVLVPACFFIACTPHLLAQSPATQATTKILEKSGKPNQQEPTSADGKMQEAFVIQESATNVTFENDGTETRQSEARIQILSEVAFNAGE
jgi:hypothetical protein